MKTKHPNVAGAFYPGEKEELRTMIQGFLDTVESKEFQNIHALIAPHAGYTYSGKTAANGYKQFLSLPKKHWKVLVMAPSHYASFSGISIGDYDSFETPLGSISVDRTMVKSLLSIPSFSYNEDAFTKEHALEVQLPFLQMVLPDFSIIPLIFGKSDPKEVAMAINPFIDDDTLIVASSDLSHFYPYDEAIGLDQNCITAIQEFNFAGMMYEEACGKHPILTLMHIAKNKEWKFSLVDYSNSGDSVGDKMSVVGYASMIGESE